METLIKTFCDIVTIPSPSGKEKEVDAFIQRYLRDVQGIRISFDEACKLNDSNVGNLIVTLPGTPGKATVLFAAHMDTVETGEKPILPVIENGVIRSDGTTILGADDKASIACLLESLREISQIDVRPTIIAVFTTREEQRRMGSSLLNLSEKVDFAFNVDGANNLGDFIYQMLGEVPFEIRLAGKAAHAASEPEKGVNAMKAAALLISSLPIGKDEHNNVLNIGTMQSGKANNIVPDLAVLKGQVRAYTQVGLDKLLELLETKTKEVCSQAGCTYEFQKYPEQGAPPACLAEDHPIVNIAKKAASSIRLPFTLSRGSYSSDTNYLAAKYPTLTICRGSKYPHSFDEEISIETLNGLKELILAIVKQFI